MEMTTEQIEYIKDNYLKAIFNAEQLQKFESSNDEAKKYIVKSLQDNDYIPKNIDFSNIVVSNEPVTPNIEKSGNIESQIEPVTTPVAPVEPVVPTVETPVEPSTPIEPVATPVEPSTPIEPVATPVEPATPIEPVATSVEPTEPVVSTEPVIAPVTPTEPVAVGPVPTLPWQDEQVELNDVPVEYKERFNNLSTDDQKKILEELNGSDEELQQGGKQSGKQLILRNNDVPTGAYTNTEDEIATEQPQDLEKAAFIDVLVLSAITAFFGLLSFLIILLKVM